MCSQVIIYKYNSGSEVKINPKALSKVLFIQYFGYTQWLNHLHNKCIFHFVDHKCEGYWHLFTLNTHPSSSSVLLICPIRFKIHFIPYMVNSCIFRFLNACIIFLLALTSFDCSNFNIIWFHIHVFVTLASLFSNNISKLPSNFQFVEFVQCLGVDSLSSRSGILSYYSLNSLSNQHLQMLRYYRYSSSEVCRNLVKSHILIECHHIPISSLSL